MTTSDAGRDATSAGVLSEAYEDANSAIAAEDFWATEYLLLLGPEAKHLSPAEVRRNHAGAARSLVRALDIVRRTGTAADRAFVRRLLIEQRRYLGATHRLFARIDAKDAAGALQIEVDEINSLYASIEASVKRATGPHRAAAARGLTTLDSVAQLVLLSTLVGLLLISVLAGALIRLRRRADRRLHSERDFLSAVLYSIEDGIVACDATGTPTVFNRAARELLGQQDEEADAEALTQFRISRPDGTLIEPEDWPLARALRGETISHLEVAVAPGNAPAREQIVSGQPLVDSDGRRIGAVLALHDITEHNRVQAALRKSEEQLRQTQKIEAVGQLAGGIAHDFNNLLTVITGYADLLRMNLETQGGSTADVDEIANAAARATELTRQLLAFSRQQVLDAQVLNLNDIVSDIGSLLGRLIGDNIDLVVHPAADLWRIEADRSQIDQVLMNLVVNARDAMPGGGKISVETSNVHLDESFRTADGGASTGPHVKLVVRDEGCGMDTDTLARVFEPFFTTKGEGEGTGLGLATVYGIVAQSGGSITAESEPGQGTQFQIFLPRVDAALDIRSADVPAGAVPLGSETIMVVEDQATVRELAVKILSTSGYNVIEAANPLDAARIFQLAEGAIALVLSDILMPEMTGVELAEELTQRQPDIKILLMSGHAGIGPGSEIGERAFIQKPFTPASLTRKVRVVLDELAPHAAVGA
jgi:PAS domain S-box-containing protein